MIIFTKAATVVAVLLAVVGSTIAQQSTDRFNVEGAGHREREDVRARFEWEFNRLRDPDGGRIPRNIRSRELMFSRTIPSKDEYSALYRSVASFPEWKRRGPTNAGGRTRALALDITDERIVLAGGASGGLWRSTDAGASWTKTTAPTDMQNVTSIVQDIRPGHTNVWYYGTGELFSTSAAYYGDGLFKSIDSGLTWRPLTATASGTVALDNPFDLVNRIAIDPSNADQEELYAATATAIQRSTDGGATWTVVLGGLNRGGIMTDVAVTSTGVVYAAIADWSGDPNGPPASVAGVFRSDDGVHWTEITPSWWPGGYIRVVLALAPSNEQTVYCLADVAGFGVGNAVLARYAYLGGDGSGDGGDWENRSDRIPNFGGVGGLYISQSGYCMALAVKPDDENALFLGGVLLYRSTDGFASTENSAWIGGANPNYVGRNYTPKTAAYDNHWVDQHAIVFSRRNPSVMYSGNDGGVFRTSDCMADTVKWEDLNNGYVASQFYTVAIDHGSAGNSAVIGGAQDIGIYLNPSVDGAGAWAIQHPTGDGAYCAIVDGGASLVTSIQDGEMIRLERDAQGQYSRFAYLKPQAPVGQFLNPFVLDPNNPRMMYFIGWGTIWRNTDITAIPTQSAASVEIGIGTIPSPTINWQELSATTTADFIKMTTLAVSTANPPNRLYYGTEQGRIYRLDNADMDNPLPVDVTGREFPRNANPACIAIDPTDASRAVVVFSNYNVVSLFATTDAGETWTAVAGNLEQYPNGQGSGPSCLWAAVHHRNGAPTWFVGTTTGLYSTTELDGSRTTWTREGGSSIGNMIVQMIDIRRSDGFMAIATHGNGIYTAYAGTSGAVEKDGVATTVAHLDEPSPNPAVSDAIIRFTLHRDCRVSVTLFDELGNRMRTVLEGALTAGEHDVRVTTADLASGVYFYQLECDGFSQTRQLIVER